MYVQATGSELCRWKQSLASVSRVSRKPGQQGGRPGATRHWSLQVAATVASAEDRRFSHLVVSDSLRPPCMTAQQASLSITSSQILLKLMSIKSVIPPSSHPAIPFSSCLQPCSASGFFPMSQFFTSGGQSNGASASSSVLPMNIQS